MAFKDNWSHYWEVNINADSVISSAVSDWPCLVTDEHFPAGAWAQMNADGSDLRFSSDADGNTELYYDDPRLDVAGEEAHLYVQVPSLASGADTTIYAWVGNAEASAPSAAWKQNTYHSDIAAWWPMEEGSGTAVGDRTANSNDGTMQNMDPETDWVQDGTTGGWSLEFDGDNDYVSAGNDSSLAPSAISICAWGQVREQGSDGYIISKRDGGDANWGLWAMSGADSAYLFGGNSGSNIATAQPVGTAWTHVTGVISPTGAAAIYLDGICDATGDITPPDVSSVNVLMGARGKGYPSTARHLAGLVGHISVFAIVLSADEIALHHLMLDDPATWATAGALENIDISYNSDIILKQENNSISYSVDMELVYSYEPEGTVIIENAEESGILTEIIWDADTTGSYAGEIKKVEIYNIDTLAWEQVGGNYPSSPISNLDIPIGTGDAARFTLEANTLRDGIYTTSPKLNWVALNVDSIKEFYADIIKQIQNIDNSYNADIALGGDYKQFGTVTLESSIGKGILEEVYWSADTTGNNAGYIYKVEAYNFDTSTWEQIGGDYPTSPIEGLSITINDGNVLRFTLEANTLIDGTYLTSPRLKSVEFVYDPVFEYFADVMLKNYDVDIPYSGNVIVQITDISPTYGADIFVTNFELKPSAPIGMGIREPNPPQGGDVKAPNIPKGGTTEDLSAPSGGHLVGGNNVN